MDSVTAVSIEEHLKVIETVRARAEALLEADVLEPDIPMMIFIKETGIAAAGAREHFDAMAKVGFKEEAVVALETDLKALDSAQQLWNTERRGGRGEEAQRLIDESEEYRGDLLSAADLALRKNADAQKRIALIREGDGLADLISDLKDLAVLITDYKAEFAEIKVDTEVAPREAAKRAADLQTVLSNEKVAKTLKGYKELRDRCYTLTANSLEEVKRFADHAFRKDKTEARRNLFTSAYTRQRDRAARKKKKQAKENLSTPTA